MKPAQRIVRIRCLALLAGIVFAPVTWAVDLSSYDGPDLYRRFCASCHGVGGRGDGPVSSALAVVTPDLSHIAKRHGGRFPQERIFQIIDGRLTRPPHGTRDMPVWGWELSRVDGDDPAAQARAQEVIAKLVEFLRAIQRE